MEVKYIISAEWLYHEKDGELFLIGAKGNIAYKAKRIKKDFILSFEQAKNKEEAFSEILNKKMNIDITDLELLFSELLNSGVLMVA
jgi:hypothetical protein